MTWSANAPSNIALIKYMGKKKTSLHEGQTTPANEATNPSFSYTLPHLITRVEISESMSGEDTWQLLEQKDFYHFEMSQTGLTKFLNYFAFLKTKFGMKGYYQIHSGNNFPADCGIASSASSFAALTLATYKLAREKFQINEWTMEQLALISRRGSGSSCRSFFGPWCLWDDSVVRQVNLPVEISELLHMVVLSSATKKKVSSSEAHKRVSTSLLFDGREERTRLRLQALQLALAEKKWNVAFEVSWAEFWDMHALFETSHPSFGYFEASSFEVLDLARTLWSEKNDGPIVTMDAGPNVHLLFRKDQKEIFSFVREKLSKRFKIISSI